MRLNFNNGENESGKIRIKGKCTITCSDIESENKDVIVYVDNKKVSVMIGTEEKENPADIELGNKYSIFTTITGLDGNSKNLTQKDIALAKEQYKNGGEIWNTLKTNGVTDIRYDNRAGVATINIGGKGFLRIDFETRIEKIREFFGIDKKTDNAVGSIESKTVEEENLNTQSLAIESTKTNYQSYSNFLIDLAKRESTSNLTTINELGFAGLYQIGEEAFASLGIYTEEGENAYKKNDWCGKFTGKYGINSLDDFLNNEKIQKKVLADLMKYNWKQIKRLQLDKDFLGRKINGQIITESSLLAAAHLGGVGSLESYLRENQNRKDKNGKSIAAYINEFAFYNMKEITGENPITKPRPRPPKIVEEEISYTVKAGDNLGKIAAKHNTSVKEIMDTNHLKNDKLKIGQKLTIFIPKDY